MFLLSFISLLSIATLDCAFEQFTYGYDAEVSRPGF